MSDLISRPAAIEKLNERAREMFSILPGFEYYLGALHDAAADLRNMQTIDAVPVVRCKDCKCRDTISCGMQFYGYDDDGRLCLSDDFTQDDGFCYWGEKKDV